MNKITKFLKGLLISQPGTNTPAEIEITPAGTASTKTTITSSQTTNKTVTLPDATTTLVGTDNTQNITNKAIANSTINNTPIGQDLPAAGAFTTVTTSNAILNGGSIDGIIIGATTPAAGYFTNISTGGSPAVNEDSVQTLSNKSLVDNTTVIVDVTDATKKFKVDVTGTASTTTTLRTTQTTDRTLTLPDVTDTLVARTTAETLTNKELTSPIINGGQIDDAVIGGTVPATGIFTTLNGDNLTITADALIQGNLTVNGTTTTLNTQNLDVTDKNITVSRGGNDAAAEGAGLTVDRTTTDGSIIYKAASATKWAAGDAGSEDDLVGATATQTLTNKTLTSPAVTGGSINNTVIGNTTPAAGTFTTMAATSGTIGGAAVTTDTNTQTLTNKTLTSPVINSPTGITKSDVGLGNVDNTSDATKNSAIATLTNKDIDGGTASNSNRVTLPKNSTANLNLLTRKQGTLVFDTTTNKPYYDDGSLLKVIGGGSGGGAKNLITDGDAEGTNILTAYNCTAGARPTGSLSLGATQLSSSISSSTPLDGTNSFLITKAAANAQGQMVAAQFTMPFAYCAKALQISFNYSVVSGTFTAGAPGTDSSIIMYIQDLDNGTFIEPSNIKLLSNSTTIADQFNATFQSSADGGTYRLLFYVPGTSTSAFVLKVDNIQVSPSTYVYGTPVTDSLVQTTIAITATITGPTKGTIVKDRIRYRRDGEFLEAEYFFEQSSGGTAGSGEYLFALPTGLSADLTKVTAHTGAAGNAMITSTIGRGNQWSTTGPSTGINSAILYDATRFRLSGSLFFNGAATQFFFNGAATFNLGEVVGHYVYVRVPILGWSSSVQTSDQTDTRVVSYSGVTPLTSVSGTTAITLTAEVDTHNAQSSNTVVIQVAGIYDIEAEMTIRGTAAAVSNTLNIILNGSTIKAGVSSTSITNQQTVVSAKTERTLKTGDVISFSTVASNTTGIDYSSFKVRRLSGPSAIAATESVNLSYSSSAGGSIGTSDTLQSFATKAYDSHGAWSGNTFTAPTSGKYRITSAILTAAVVLGTSQSIYLSVYKNGVSYRRIDNRFGSGANVSIGMAGSTTVNLIAGDTIALYATSVVATSQFTNVAFNFIDIERIGL